VVAIGRRNVTFLRSGRCRICVKWFNFALPPKVKVGAAIMVYGKLMTLHNGRVFQLVDSVVFNGRSGRTVLKELSKALDRFIVDPSTYLAGMAENGNGQP